MLTLLSKKTDRIVAVLIFFLPKFKQMRAQNAQEALKNIKKKPNLVENAFE